MLWLDEQWPEDRAVLHDITETVVPVNFGTNTKVAAGDTRRIGIVFSLPVFANGISVTTTATVLTNQGFPITSANLYVALVGYGYEALASRQWNCINSGGGNIQLSILSIVLNRPFVRPPMPGTPIQIDLPDDGKGKLAKMLKKQQKWRKKVYEELLKRGYQNGQSVPAGPRMAGLVPGGLRQPQSSLPALPAAQQLFF